MGVEIREDDLKSEQTRDLLRLHLNGMHENTPAKHVFALDLSGLQAPGITVWSAWSDGRIAGIGALKELGNGTAEVKSMRTHPDHLRKGVGAAILERIVQEARRRGVRRLSLETGRGPAFERLSPCTDAAASFPAGPSVTTGPASSASSCTWTFSFPRCGCSWLLSGWPCLPVAASRRDTRQRRAHRGSG